MPVSFKFPQELLDNDTAEPTVQTPMAVDALLLKYNSKSHKEAMVRYPALGYSVVNVFADSCACVCFRWTHIGDSRPVQYCGLNFYRISFTRAEWLWSFNFVCLLAHFLMAFLCFTSCNSQRFGTTVNANCTASAMSVTIYRFKTTWSSDEAARVLTMSLVDNGRPIRFDRLVGWFFLISGIFHTFPVVVGPFDQFVRYYWAQIDNCFCYWRCA